MSEGTEVGLAESSNEDAVPRLVEGVSLCGEYEGGSFDEPRYLLARADGQMVLASQGLYRVATLIDGHRTLREVAEQLNRSFDADVSAQDVEYLVNDKLYPLGIATTSEPLADPPRADPLLSLAFHGVLAPARLVRAVAPVLAPLYRPAAIVLMLCAFVGVDVWLVSAGLLDAAFHRSAGDPVHVLVLLGLLAVSTLFHELGHAAGCHYGGARPGAIGVGIMILFPCLYTNVTDAYRLDRRGRLRTDLGGLYFNAVFIVAMTGVYALTHYPPLLVFMTLSQLQMLQQLLPLLRMDGYYILGDLVGVPNLFAYVRPMMQRLTGRRKPGTPVSTGLRPRAHIIVTVWVAIVVPALCLLLTLLLIRLPAYLATGLTGAQRYGQLAVTGIAHGHVGIVLLAAVSIVLLLLPWLGASAFACRTGKRLARLISRHRSRKQCRRHTERTASSHQNNTQVAGTPGS